MVVVAEFGLGGVPIDLVDHSFDRFTADGGDREIVVAEMHDFIVVQINDVLGAVSDRVDIASEQVFTFA